MITTEDSVTLQKHHKVREEGTTDHMSILDFISEEMHCGTAGQFKGTQYFLLSRWWETFSVDTVIFNKFKYFLWLNIYIIILGINIEILHSMAELYLFYMIRIFMTLTKNIKKLIQTHIGDENFEKTHLFLEVSLVLENVTWLTNHSFVGITQFSALRYILNNRI